LESGQSFAAAASPVNLIAGASVWFHDASTAGLSERDDRGRRFCETLTAYWPWDDGEIVDAAAGTRLLYACVRNPLAHAFAMPGIDDDPLVIEDDRRSVRQTMHHAGDLLMQARRRRKSTAFCLLRRSFHFHDRTDPPAKTVDRG